MGSECVYFSMASTYNVESQRCMSPETQRCLSPRARSPVKAEELSPVLSAVNGRRPATAGAVGTRRMPPRMPGHQAPRPAGGYAERPASPPGWSSRSVRSETPSSAPLSRTPSRPSSPCVSVGSLRRKLSTAEKEEMEIETKRLEVKQMLQRNRRRMEARKAAARAPYEDFASASDDGEDCVTMTPLPPQRAVAGTLRHAQPSEDEFSVQRVTFSPEAGLHPRSMSPSSVRRFRMF